MHTESLMMLIPALQVSVASAAVALSGYLMVTRLYSHIGRRLGS